MAVPLRDRKLNISTAYLRPGFAFGGLLPAQDLRAPALSRQDQRSYPVMCSTPPLRPISNRSTVRSP